MHRLYHRLRLRWLALIGDPDEDIALWEEPRGTTYYFAITDTEVGVYDAIGKLLSKAPRSPSSIRLDLPPRD